MRRVRSGQEGCAKRSCDIMRTFLSASNSNMVVRQQPGGEVLLRQLCAPPLQVGNDGRCSVVRGPKQWNRK